MEIMETQRVTYGNKTYEYPRSRYHNDRREDGRRLPSGAARKTFVVAEMNERHHEIARLLVLGTKPKDVARELDISYAQVMNVKNSPVVREQMMFLQGARDDATVDVMKQIQAALPDCVKYLIDSVDDDDVSHTTRSKNAFGLMGVAGYGQTKNVNIKGVHAVLNAEDLMEIKSRASEIANEIGLMAKEGEIVDI